MYQSFYSLSGTPFSKEIQTKQFFASEAFSEADGRLEYLKKTRGIGMVTGEPGAGKTFILRSFTERLSSDLFKVIYFPLSTGTVMDFYRGIAKGLGEEPKFRKVDLFHQIQHAILLHYKDRRITPVFILDEMQMAKDLFLSDLSILFNFGMDSENPFILVLAGLPHLLDRLTLRRVNWPLFQRIVMHYKVEPLSKTEVAGYISHHMELAGAKHHIFTDTAVEAIAALSRGWPRLVNNLATHCLICGFQMKKDRIDEEIVRIASVEAGL
ncbi:ExeA family protein [Dethiobacter alkaliphilus]|uniref:ExeA family protein n=1 Tax=Dethiobacter alkaliphilus TaxID=427926 RepID=UPI0022279F14|nr:AAA family ATPase [Dethiobacter alkaliphilus]MCW3491712.1 AAA family ATPase [Dethiobacter alkaliphilus]